MDCSTRLKSSCIAITKRGRGPARCKPGSPRSARRSPISARISTPEVGWPPPTARSAFDLLPLVVRDLERGVRLFGLPRDIVREVPLEHPELGWFVDLGLRWHAVGARSQLLGIGGLRYPAVFNGIYTS